ncbi:MAG: sporulation initiation factor Spo0A C-terminal domain-containing protein [Eubacteriales bacterium]|nr:sporulation initiation factor Spo0A C-terminal domain-containing protein [Eubacteriales bacterium]
MINDDYWLDEILRRLGITEAYKGYDRVKMAVCLALEDEKRLVTFRDSIYKYMAEEENGNWKSVEKNFRTVVKRAWTINPELLQELAGYRMYWAPTVSEFISNLVSYRKKQIKKAAMQAEQNKKIEIKNEQSVQTVQKVGSLAASGIQN